MTKLIWDQTDLRTYEYGVSRGVLYPHNEDGVAWNGLISVKETSSEETDTPVYVDGVKYLGSQVINSFSASIEAFTYPDEFLEYDGSIITSEQTELKRFNLCYRTNIGNSQSGEYGYKLHIVYNAWAIATEKINNTVNEAPNAVTFNWDFTTIPISIVGARDSSHLIIDSTKAHPWVMDSMEDILYGSVNSPPTLPTPEQIVLHFEEAALVRVIDHGDGTFSVTGPDAWVHLTDSTSFEISWESAVFIDEVSYQLSSL